MKYLVSRTIICLAVVGVLSAWIGCSSTKDVRTKDLVVVELKDSIRGNNENNEHEWATFTVDVPLNGPKALVDSVVAFVNKELYDACESNAHFDENVVTYSREELYSDDAENLLRHYLEKYRTHIQDSLWRVFGLTMKMEAQTDKFVTYGIEFFYCGANCSSEKMFYTFDKGDGHKIKDIISHDNLVRFFADYPEYNNIGADAWTGEPGWQFSPDYDFLDSSYGLMDNCFMISIPGAGNHYMLTDFPYSQIFSYLSPEVQALLEQKGEEEPMLPAYLPERSEDGEVWMEVDTINNALLGYIRAAGGPLVSTLMTYDPELEIYPKRVHSIDASEGSTVFLFIYSRGHLLYCDEALTCVIDEDGLKPAKLFSLEGQKDSVISCMWYDELVAASNGFPYEELDENRFGIHYDRFTKRLYYPILDNHEKGSGFENCQRYTGRYEVLSFNGREFVPAGTDGAWWLNPDMRNYKRTISSHKTAEGIEQVDLMPDSTYRRAVWLGAKTLDDLRKVPDSLLVSKNPV